MAKYAGTFAEGWQLNWTVNFRQRRAVHMPSGLVVELRRSEANQWYPFALDAETWLFADQSRLQSFIDLLHEAEVLFHQTVPETGWLPYHGAPVLIEGPRTGKN